MSIVPLPQFEEDLRELQEQRATRDALPSTVVVRYGRMKMVGEFPFGGRVRPGCGSKIVVRTSRGIELGELLTSTCPNSGCGSSVSRQEMLEYIERSGGRDYPFSTKGKALRVATKEDMDRQARIEQTLHGIRMDARGRAERLGLGLKIAEVEPLLGGERIVFFYLAEHRVDLTALSRELREHHGTQIEFQQVGSRDEARLTADYERCGQYCCCKNFLKVLKPVSMRSAKVQKATLDPLKISGRCGRLMCCLRYEDQTYEDLRKRLPHRKKRVGTPEGDGMVLDSQILTQLVLVLLDGTDTRVAIPVEELTEPTGTTAVDLAGERAQRAASERRAARPEARADRRSDVGGSGRTQRPARPGGEAPGRDGRAQTDGSGPAQPPRKRRKRRRSGGSGQGAGQAGGPPAGGDPHAGGGADSGGRSADAGDGARGSSGPHGGSKKKRKRRRRRRPGGGDGGGRPEGGSGGGPGGGGSGGGPGGGSGG